VSHPVSISDGLAVYAHSTLATGNGAWQVNISCLSDERDDAATLMLVLDASVSGCTSAKAEHMRFSGVPAVSGKPWGETRCAALPDSVYALGIGHVKEYIVFGTSGRHYRYQLTAPICVWLSG
jgi:hypothetical protein